MSALYSSLSLAGQTVLVTGASAGIGEACARRFAEAGCHLVLTARRAERLAALKQELTEQYKVRVHTVALDVRDTDRVLSLPRELPPDFQQIDILVNNAGLALGVAPAHQNDLQDVKQMVDTNVTAVAAFTRAFVPAMVERNAGHVINISSTAGHITYPGGSVYCGTKHFIEAFTDATRLDLMATDIRVTAISPGAVRTEFSQVRFKGDGTKADAVYEGFVPLNAADVADNVLYAATRPAHVQIGEIVVYATHQGSGRDKANVLKAK